MTNLFDNAGVSRIAVHEAGHAVLAILLRCPVSSISIEAIAQYDGYTETPDIIDRFLAQRLSLHQVAIFTIAGVVAEKITLGLGHMSYYRSDLQKVRAILSEIYGANADLDRHELALRTYCGEILKEPPAFSLLLKIAKSLDERKSLSQSDTQVLLNSQGAWKRLNGILMRRARW